MSTSALFSTSPVGRVLDRPLGVPRASCVFAHELPLDGTTAAALSTALVGRGLEVEHVALVPDDPDDGRGAGARVAAAWRALDPSPDAPRLFIGHGAGARASLDAAADHRGPRARLRGRAVVLVNARLDAETLEAARAIDLPVLVVHADDDATSPWADGLALFDALPGPKSFLTTRGGHDLSRTDELSYVTASVDAFITRVLPLRDADPEPGQPTSVVVSEAAAGRLVNDVYFGRHHICADEPTSAGGSDRGPSPYDFLLAGLGACTAMTLRSYADRKGWPLRRVRVRLEHTKFHADAIATCETKDDKLDRITRIIQLDGDLDADQQRRLLQIAEKCPVHRTLHAEMWIVSRLEDPGAGAS